MNLRKLLSTDIPIIDWIWRTFHRGKFGIPSLKNVIADRVVVEGNQILAYGMVKSYAEAVMILDLNLSVRDRVEALKLLMADAEKTAKLAGIEQLQVFVQNENFKNILMDHFGFKPCVGSPLYKSLE